METDHQVAYGVNMPVNLDLTKEIPLEPDRPYNNMIGFPFCEAICNMALGIKYLPPNLNFILI